jgi:hypothetical protein
MSTFFGGILEGIPSLFRGNFSERNSVANPTRGPYTETIDLCFEPFFVKEKMRVIE